MTQEKKYKAVRQMVEVNKQSGEGKKVYPVTPIQAVYDARTGASLEAILAQFNNVFLQYQGSAAATRCLLPKELRRVGITISYRTFDDSLVTERCMNDAQRDNEHWGLDVNWARVDGQVVLSGELGVSEHGTWVVNGVDTNINAQGPKGDAGLTPWLKTIDNKLHYSYDGVNWEVTSEDIAAWFRWNNNKIQISRDNKTWSDLTGVFADNLFIKGYVATYAELPTAAWQGDIWGVGPTYAETDTEQTNPIYRYYVRNANGWVDNGSFTSIAAGIVQETGDGENVVMSQKAVSEKFGELEEKTVSIGNEGNNRLSICDSQGNIIAIINGGIKIMEDGRIITSSFDSVGLVKASNDDENIFSICDSKGNIIAKINGGIEIDKDGNIITSSFDSRNGSNYNEVGRSQFPKIDYHKPTFRWLDIGNSHSNCALFYLRSIAISQGVDLSNVAFCRVSRGGSAFEDWYNGYHDQDTSGEGDALTGGMYNLTQDFGGLKVHVKGNQYTQVKGTPTPIDTDVTRSQITWWGGDCSILRSLLKDNEWDLITIHQRYVLNEVYDESNGWTEDLNPSEYEYSNTGKTIEFIRILKTLNPNATIGYLNALSPFGYSDYKVTYNSESWDNTIRTYQKWNETMKKFLADSGVDLFIPCNTALMNLRSSSVSNVPKEWDATSGNLSLLDRWGFNYDASHTAFGVAGYTMACTAWEVVFAPRFRKSIYGNTLREMTEHDINTASSYFLRPSYVNAEGNRVIIDEADGAWNKPVYAGMTSNDGGTTWQYTDRATSVVRVNENNAIQYQMAAIIAVNDMWNINNPDNVEL